MIIVSTNQHLPAEKAEDSVAGSPPSGDVGSFIGVQLARRYIEPAQPWCLISEANDSRVVSVGNALRGRRIGPWSWALSRRSRPSEGFQSTKQTSFVLLRIRLNG